MAVSSKGNPTILRVKRRLEEDPAEALILTTQGAKRSRQQTEILTFDLVGTSSNKVPELLDIRPRNPPKSVSKVALARRKSRRREQSAFRSAENRYKLISKNREQSGFCDIEKDEDDDDDVITLNGVPLRQVQYVYDFYRPQILDKEIPLDSVIEIQSFLPPSTSSEDSDSDSDDSNDENNYRNDYPDEETESEYCDEDEDFGLERKLKLYDSSDEDGNEDLIYSVTEADEEMYGLSYAQYRRRMLKEMEEDAKLDELSEDSD